MAQANRKHIAVVGQQRTGTTALRQCLGSAPGYFDLGEIFSIHATELQVNWWGWLAQQAAAAPVSVCPTSWRDGWADYLSAQREQSGARYFVFDLKAEFMGNALLSNEDGSWFFFRTDDVMFVHIERKNLVAQIVSRLRAESTREWAWRDSEADATMKARHSRSFERRGGGVSWQDDDQPMTRAPVLHVPAESLISELQRVEKLNGWVRETLAPYETVHLCYEELFDEAGDFHPDVIRTIATAAGTAPASYARRPLMLKQAAVDFLDGVSNREELKARLAGTRYGWMVDA